MHRGHSAASATSLCLWALVKGLPWEVAGLSRAGSWGAACGPPGVQSGQGEGPVGSLTHGVASVWGLLACEVRQRVGSTGMWGPSVCGVRWYVGSAGM